MASTELKSILVLTLHVGTIALLGFVDLPSTQFMHEMGRTPCVGSDCAHDGEWVTESGQCIQQWVMTGMGQFAEPGNYVLKVPKREFRITMRDGGVSPVYYDPSQRP